MADKVKSQKLEVKSEAKKDTVKSVVASETKKVTKEVKKTEKVASVVKTPEVKSEEKKKQTGLTIDVVTPTGEKKGSIKLPEEMFDAKVNKPLIAQAIRIYLANQRKGNAKTKTRGEVEGSTRKIYKQKGTGNARHGSIRAPIFVGGGDVFGPRPRDYSLDFSKPMKKKALASAFTSKLQHGDVIIVTDISSLPLKTKEFATMFMALECKRSTLLLYGKEEGTIIRAMRNLENVSYMAVSQAHTYALIHSRHVVMTEQAVKELATTN